MTAWLVTDEKVRWRCGCGVTHVRIDGWHPAVQGRTLTYECCRCGDSVTWIPDAKNGAA